MASPELMAALAEQEPEEGEEIPLLEPRDRFDQCLLGIAERFNSRFAVYDKACIIRVLTEDTAPSDDDDFDPESDAIEHYEFNVRGGWIGEGTPAFLMTNPEEL